MTATQLTGTPEQIAQAEGVRDQVIAMMATFLAQSKKSKSRAHELGRMDAETLAERMAQDEQAAAAVLAYPEAHLWVSMSIYGVQQYHMAELRKIVMLP